MQYEVEHSEMREYRAVDVYMSFPFVYELAPAFLRCLLVAKSALSMSEATVRTPPTMAHVLCAVL